MIDFPEWIQVNDSLITFKHSGTLPDGVEYIVLCMPGTDHAHVEYMAAPMALVYQGVVYGRASYNSDKLEILYRTDKQTAIAVR